MERTANERTSLPQGRCVPCRPLIAFINDGSHSIFDDLVVSFDESSLENYLRVFKLIFERLHHIDHYNMMMRVNSDTEN